MKTQPKELNIAKALQQIKAAQIVEDILMQLPIFQAFLCLHNPSGVYFRAVVLKLGSQAPEG